MIIALFHSQWQFLMSGFWRKGPLVEVKTKWYNKCVGGMMSIPFGLWPIWIQYEKQVYPNFPCYCNFFFYPLLSCLLPLHPLVRNHILFYRSKFWESWARWSASGPAARISLIFIKRLFHPILSRSQSFHPDLLFLLLGAVSWPKDLHFALLRDPWPIPD